MGVYDYDKLHDNEVSDSLDYNKIESKIKLWCWGGFLLGPLWGVFNRAAVSILYIIPFVVFFINDYLGLALGFFINIYLGLKGRKISWESGGWSSFQAFEKHQKG